MEFVGEGIDNLSVDFRIGIDVMTTETTCLSSIWRTDDAVKNFMKFTEEKMIIKKWHRKKLLTMTVWLRVDLSTIKPMIAMPFHPNVCTPEELDALSLLEYIFESKLA